MPLSISVKTLDSTLAPRPPIAGAPVWRWDSLFCQTIYALTAPGGKVVNLRPCRSLTGPAQQQAADRIMRSPVELVRISCTLCDDHCLRGVLISVANGLSLKECTVRCPLSFVCAAIFISIYFYSPPLLGMIWFSQRYVNQLISQARSSLPKIAADRRELDSHFGPKR